MIAVIEDTGLRSTLARVANALDDLDVAWAVGGSFASTVYGEPRATNDIDLIAALRLHHVANFVAALGEDFYADEPAIREAIAARSSCNLIDQRAFLKVDVFVPPEGPLGEGQLQRRRRYQLPGGGPTLFILGPEDTILQKVRWYELGGRVSDRQWRDIVGIVRTREALDLEYLREVARGAGLSALVERAFEEGA